MEWTLELQFFFVGRFKNLTDLHESTGFVGLKPPPVSGLYFDHGFDTIPMHNVSSQIVVDGPGTILQRGLASKLAMLHVPESCLGREVFFRNKRNLGLRYRDCSFGTVWISWNGGSKPT